MLLDNYCNTHGRLVSKQRRPTAVAQFLNNFSLEERHTVTNILLSLGLRMYGCAVPSTPADISTLRSALDMELVVRARGRDEGTKAIAAVATHSSGCPNSSPDAEQRHLAPGPNAQEAFTLVDGEPLPRPFAVAANNETVRSTPTQPNSGDIPDAEEGHANDTEGAKFETKHQESEAMYGFGEQARRGNAGEQRSVDHLNSEYPADAGVEIKQGGCRTALDFVIREALSLSLGDHAPIIHVHPEGVGLTPSSPSTSPSANALNLQTAECSLEPGEVSEKKTVALQKTLSSSSSALPPLFCNNVEVYPMDFCKSLIRHIELTNGVRQNPILVAASLPQSLAVFTLYSSFSSLYKSLLVSYHVSAATGTEFPL
ncbi:hypothetical protein TRVL_00816 [Trypanosoma vivax]|uniref:Uncharacterized protein n=1 Tax=Trypanosoma vivax (strain Y486) TaxID=1055687 RepID=G0U7T3_TRYVY|nr:hypothetical protein TRVL_00816 [Trypanosoma vivax]CCC51941.1 conserved hypothetical protein [Trypanosoma vivax Y486]